MNLNLAFKQFASWPIMLLMMGCASQGEINTRTETRAAAVLGVTIAPGVESGRSLNSMTQEFEDLMRSNGNYSVLRSIDVSRAVNAVTPESFDTILANYSKSGQLKGADLKALQAAHLPIQTAVIARIERNVVRAGSPKRIALYNSMGNVLSDRERVLLSTVREMQVRASMINVPSGRVVWSKAYRATPASESSYVHYSGSSFSGSLAASFANTMSNGLRAPSGPTPPSNRLTVRSILREIVRKMP